MSALQVFEEPGRGRLAGKGFYRIRRRSMKKVVAILVACIMMIVLGVGLLVVALSGSDHETVMGFTDEITCVDGEIFVNGSPRKPHIIPLEIGYDVSYDLHVVWKEENNRMPGFITALIIKDDQGKVISYVTGDVLDAHLLPDQMKAGKYTLEYSYYNAEEEFIGLLNELGAEPSNENGDYLDGFSDFAVDGTWNMVHSFEMIPHNTPYRMGYVVGAFGGLLCGVIGAVIIVLVSRKDGKMKADYDERQILARGVAFQAAFFTMLIYYALLYFFQTLEVPLPIAEDVLTVSGILLSVVVFVGMAIWKDAYFALNDKNKSLICFFLVIGFIDLAMGITNIRNERVIVNGICTNAVLPLLSGIMFALILIMLVLKSVIDREDE